MTSPRARAAGFCARYGLGVPMLQAPMAGVSPVGLAVAIAKAGGMGARGALMLPPDAIGAWAQAFRAQSNGAFQVNPPVPESDPPREDAARAALAAHGPVLPALGPGPFVQDVAAEALLA